MKKLTCSIIAIDCHILIVTEISGVCDLSKKIPLSKTTFSSNYTAYIHFKEFGICRNVKKSGQ